MRKLNILKSLIDIFFVFSIIGGVALLITVPMLMFSGEAFPVNIKGREVLVDNAMAKLLILAVMVSSFIFLYAIYLLRQTIGCFIKHEIFSAKVILNLKKIGICLIASSLLASVTLFFYNMLHHQHIGFSIDSGSDSLFLSLVLGLFFMVLSEVFKIANRIKEENDLTL